MKLNLNKNKKLQIMDLIINPLPEKKALPKSFLFDLLMFWKDVRPKFSASINKLGRRNNVRFRLRSILVTEIYSSLMPKIWKNIKEKYAHLPFDKTFEIRRKVEDSVWESILIFVRKILNYDYNPTWDCIANLFSSGYIPSYDGQTWRIHICRSGKVCYELS